MIDPSLLALLACPRSKEPLEKVEQKDLLYCRAENLYYPIKEGIPRLLADEAIPGAVMEESG